MPRQHLNEDDLKILNAIIGFKGKTEEDIPKGMKGGGWLLKRMDTLSSLSVVKKRVFLPHPEYFYYLGDNYIRIVPRLPHFTIKIGNMVCLKRRQKGLYKIPKKLS